MTSIEAVLFDLVMDNVVQYLDSVSILSFQMTSRLFWRDIASTNCSTIQVACRSPSRLFFKFLADASQSNSLRRLRLQFTSLDGTFLDELYGSISCTKLREISIDVSAVSKDISLPFYFRRSLDRGNSCAISNMESFHGLSDEEFSWFIDGLTTLPHLVEIDIGELLHRTVIITENMQHIIDPFEAALTRACDVLTSVKFPSVKTVKLSHLQLELFVRVISRFALSSSFISFGMQIESLVIDFDSLTAHDHWMCQAEMAELSKSIQHPLFPNLRHFDCNHWLPSPTFLFLLVNGPRRVMTGSVSASASVALSTSIYSASSAAMPSAPYRESMGLSVLIAAGLEDPATSTFLASIWDEQDPASLAPTSGISRSGEGNFNSITSVRGNGLRIHSLHIRRRERPTELGSCACFSRRKSCYCCLMSNVKEPPEPQQTKTTDEQEENGDDFSDEYDVDQEYDCFEMPTPVPNALSQAVLSGKCRYLRSFGVTEDFLHLLGCFQDLNTMPSNQLSSARSFVVQKVQSHFSRCEALKKLVVYLHRPLREQPQQPYSNGASNHLTRRRACPPKAAIIGGGKDPFEDKAGEKVSMALSLLICGLYNAATKLAVNRKTDDKKVWLSDEKPSLSFTPLFKDCRVFDGLNGGSDIAAGKREEETTTERCTNILNGEKKVEGEDWTQCPRCVAGEESLQLCVDVDVPCVSLWHFLRTRLHKDLHDFIIPNPNLGRRMPSCCIVNSSHCGHRLVYSGPQKARTLYVRLTGPYRIDTVFSVFL